MSYFKYISYINLIESIFIDNTGVDSITLKISGYDSEEEFGLSLLKINDTEIPDLGRDHYVERNVQERANILSLLIELNLKTEDFLLIQSRLSITEKFIVIFLVNSRLNVIKRKQFIIHRNQLNTLKTYFSNVKDSDV